MRSRRLLPLAPAMLVLALATLALGACTTDLPTGVRAGHDLPAAFEQ